MFKQLRDLFRRTEPEKEALGLAFDDLPAWLDSREEKIENELVGATSSSREAIDGILDNLEEVVARMETAEGSEEVHPRLRDISRKALPGFARSMTQILCRRPSGDPETFYTAAAETLKSALKAVKGQGKYLSSLYPDEMKEVRTTVRDLGREINAMTEAITRVRADRQPVADVRKSYDSLVHIREEYAVASGQVRVCGAALAEVEAAIRKAEEDLAALSRISKGRSVNSILRTKRSSGRSRPCGSLPSTSSGRPRRLPKRREIARRPRQSGGSSMPIRAASRTAVRTRSV
jgi:hypothetical protein